MTSWVSPQFIRLPRFQYAIATQRVGAIGITAPRRKELELLIAGGD